MKHLTTILWICLFTSPAVALPSANETCHQALVYAELAGPLDDWGSRARVSNLLPEVEADLLLKKDHGFDDDYRETLSPDEDGDLYSKTLQTTTGRASKSQWALRIRLSLSPQKLVFDPNELRARALALDLEERRQRLLDRVLELYFEWRRLRDQHHNDAEEENAIRHAESILEARIDALTGGWFHTQLRGTP